MKENISLKINVTNMKQIEQKEKKTVLKVINH